MGNDMNSIRIALASLFTVGALVGGGAHALQSLPALHAPAAHATAMAASPAGLPEECCEG
jgi:hypothetical protein